MQGVSDGGGTRGAQVLRLAALAQDDKRRAGSQSVKQIPCGNDNQKKETAELKLGRFGGSWRRLVAGRRETDSSAALRNDKSKSGTVVAGIGVMYSGLARRGRSFDCAPAIRTQVAPLRMTA